MLVIGNSSPRSNNVDQKFKNLPSYIQQSALNVIEKQFEGLSVINKRNQEHADLIVTVIGNAYVRLYEGEK